MQTHALARTPICLCTRRIADHAFIVTQLALPVPALLSLIAQVVIWEGIFREDNAYHVVVIVLHV